MFGIVARDNYANNISINDNLVVGGKVTTEYITQPTRKITTVPPLDNTTAVVNYTLQLDSSESVLGDIAIVFFKVVDPAGTNSVNISFGNNIYVTKCGDPIPLTSSLDILGFSDFAMLLTFDGEYFVQCNENG